MSLATLIALYFFVAPFAAFNTSLDGFHFTQESVVSPEWHGNETIYSASAGVRVRDETNETVSLSS